MTAPEYLTLTASQSAKAKRAKRKPMAHPEDDVQIPILNWIKRVAPQCEVFHVPNGGFRIRKEAIRLKRLGVMPGVADLFIIPPGAIYTCLEIKPVKDGRCSVAQKRFARKVIASGGHYAVVRSIDETRDRFAEWNIATREVRR